MGLGRDAVSRRETLLGDRWTGLETILALIFRGRALCIAHALDCWVSCAQRAWWFPWVCGFGEAATVVRCSPLRARSLDRSRHYLGPGSFVGRTGPDPRVNFRFHVMEPWLSHKVTDHLRPSRDAPGPQDSHARDCWVSFARHVRWSLWVCCFYGSRNSGSRVFSPCTVTRPGSTIP